MIWAPAKPKPVHLWLSITAEKRLREMIGWERSVELPQIHTILDDESHMIL